MNKKHSHNLAPSHNVRIQTLFLRARPKRHLFNVRRWQLTCCTAVRTEGRGRWEAGAGAGWGEGKGGVIDSERPEEPCSHSHYVLRTCITGWGAEDREVDVRKPRGVEEEEEGIGGIQRRAGGGEGGEVHEGMERVWQWGRGWKIGETMRGDEDISRISITDSRSKNEVICLKCRYDTIVERPRFHGVMLRD